MQDPSKTKQELIAEISSLNRRIEELESSKADRNQTEETLRMRNNLLSALLNNLQVGVFMVEAPSGKPLLANEAAVNLLGQGILSDTAAQNLATVYKAYKSDSHDLYPAEKMPILLGMSGEFAHVDDMVVERPDGTRTFLEVFGSPVTDDEGNIWASLVSFLDISDRKQAEEALRESESRFRSLFENIHVIGLVIDPANGSIVDANPAASSFYGWSRDELLGMKITQINTLSREDTLKEMGAALTDRRSYFLFQHRRADDSVRDVEVYSAPIRVGAKELLYSIIHDVTDRKLTEEKLHHTSALLRIFMDAINESAFLIDTTGRILAANETLAKRFNKKVTDLVGVTIEDIVPPDVAQSRRKYLDEVVRRKHAIRFEDERLGRTIDNAIYPVFDAQGEVQAMAIIGHDITERRRIELALRESEQRYRELSIVDDLTRLYNSRYFYFQLQSETERSNRYGQPLTLLLLDIDNFKAFNDTYGHVEGDQVLLRLGQVMKKCLRETDSAYRYGGEEFTILLPMTTVMEGVVTAERIRTEFRKETFSMVPGQEVQMTVSIGLSQYRTQEEKKAFVHRVDQLMYQGKKNGKDRVCHEQ